jgi:plasmid maintenance system antidote protein VapI
MTISQSLLSDLKAKRGGISDYRAAKILECTTSNISMIKSGRTGFGETRVIQIAKELGLDPKVALIKRLIEQAKTDEMREVLEEIEAKLTN